MWPWGTARIGVRRFQFWPREEEEVIKGEIFYYIYVRRRKP